MCSVSVLYVLGAVPVIFYYSHFCVKYELLSSQTVIDEINCALDFVLHPHQYNNVLLQYLDILTK
jgi:hypothetical protein